MPSTIVRRAYTYNRTPRTIRVASSPSHRAYTRRISGGTVRVKSSLIRNRGLPGKGPYTLPPLTPGKLYGYTVSASNSNRYKSLRVAMNKNSPLAVFRRLQILARYLERAYRTRSRYPKSANRSRPRSRYPMRKKPIAQKIVLRNAKWVRAQF